MKLFAQHGYGEGEKIVNGLSSSFIDGVIFSPRDITLANLLIKLEDYRGRFSEVELLDLMSVDA